MDLLISVSQPIGQKSPPEYLFLWIPQHVGRNLAGQCLKLQSVPIFQLNSQPKPEISSIECGIPIRFSLRSSYSQCFVHNFITSQNFEAVQQENLHNTIWNEFLSISRLNSSKIQYETVFLYIILQNYFVIVLFEGIKFSCVTNSWIPGILCFLDRSSWKFGFLDPWVLDRSSWKFGFLGSGVLDRSSWNLGFSWIRVLDRSSWAWILSNRIRILAPRTKFSKPVFMLAPWFWDWDSRPPPLGSHPLDFGSK